MFYPNIELWHKELTEWSKAIRFYDDETTVFEKKLEDVVNRNSDKTVLSETEHFQNQFILQKEQFDLLQHDLHEQEVQIKENMQAYSSHIIGSIIDRQRTLQNKMRQTEKIFSETRHNYRLFLSKVL